jgi:hypothetical protein
VNAASEWEVGFGTLDATGLILTRTTVYKSSNAGALVTFTAGTKNVFVTYPSSRSVNLDSNSVLTLASAINSPFVINNNGTGTPLSNSVASFFGSVNDYDQINHQNLNSGNAASTDYIATADNGSDTTNYVDFGINSSTYNAGTFTIAGANDGYLYAQSSNLAIGTAASAKSVKFFQGGTLTSNEVARFAPTTNNFLIGTTSDGAGTSKLRVSGTIEATTGVKIASSTNTQLFPFTPTNTTVIFGTTYPVVSGTYIISDTNATTTSKISIVPSALSTNTLTNVGTINGGSGYSSTTYYNVPLAGTQTVTITIASPAVVTTTNTIPNGTAITLTTTGALPTGLVAGTTYYVVNGSGLTLNLASTPGGAAINTSGSQSGVQSLVTSAGTGAAAAQVVVTAGAVTSVTMPIASGAILTAGITGGSGYNNGTYYNVPLTGGAGVGAIATSITISGNAVTSVVLPTTGAGSNYVVGNALTTSNANLGGAGTGFLFTVTAISSLGTGYSYGDIVFASNTNLGGAGSGFSTPVILVSGGGDELEMDGIKVSAYCATTGFISVFYDASPGYIAGGRTFTYTLG